jgi:hypothetical protein
MFKREGESRGRRHVLLVLMNSLEKSIEFCDSFGHLAEVYYPNLVCP